VIILTFLFALQPVPLLCACRAPEQVDAEFGLRGTHTDVWGFATTVLHLATGHLPYQGLADVQIVSAMLKRRLPELPSSLPGCMLGRNCADNAGFSLQSAFVHNCTHVVVKTCCQCIIAQKRVLLAVPVYTVCATQSFCLNAYMQNS